MTRLQDIYDRAEQLIARCGPMGSYIFGDDTQFGMFEHLCHELAHAFILNIEPSAGFSTEIEQTLRACSVEQAIENEAETWAVEWYALQIVGAPFEWGDVIDGAEVQGCTPEQVEAYLTPQSEKLAQQLIDFINSEGVQ